MGDVADLMVEILKSIRDETRSVREEVHSMREEMNSRFQEMNSRLSRVEHQQIETNIRLDRMIDLFGEHWRDHEKRIRRIEAEMHIEP